ncbi:30S ribosomal protein S16 [Candidatus Kaiserbacteria bacterium RIFCSPHIGHO2_01_FULL_48_10]|uniref:30S ribosomal protein S16 n=1 Tax=Candidatus Kaiserbacteria bacterium RIFCSPHIGHO2_01_FULL_48_10 TaxID=1798476 RepID=A0A1F6C607_9BACT|nr:MAG: 30S ribosomal protein S16 [Candidatus Kaiserbacteria bacterium RIFCSPHIGHO2_01_FULL_48_10]
MLTIRFQRTGRTNDPAFRIVVSEKTKHPKAGSPLQVVGSYNPKTKHTVIDADSVKHWLSKGAQASGTVNNLLINKGIIEGKKINVRLTKHPKEDLSAKAVEPAKVEASAEVKNDESPAAVAPEASVVEESKTEEAPVA